MPKDPSVSDIREFGGYTTGEGIKDGLPIGLGYLSVSFSFGILAVSKGLSWIQAVLISLTNITSAGQVAGLGIMTAAGGIIAMILSQIVINLRYSLMGIALSQKADKTMTPLLRILLSYGITDEIFGVAVSKKHRLGCRDGNRRAPWQGIPGFPYECACDRYIRNVRIDRPAQSKAR